jgi:PAS domain S-box-containing protein
MTSVVTNTWFNQLLDVPSLDAEDGRRRKLLNILLFGITGLTAVTLLVTVAGVVFQFGIQDDPGLNLLFVAMIVTLVGMGLIYAINRYWSGAAAAVVFLLLMTGILALSDAPAQIVGGRSMFLFTIPVIMASMLLRPWFSFVIAVVVDLVIVGLGITYGINYDPPSLIGFVAIAFIAWLGGRSIEQALGDLRSINRELDQRVFLRTQELANALTEVRAESNKNQAILASIADGVVVFNEVGRAFVANAAIRPLLGLSSDDILGKDLEEITRGHITEEEQKTFIERVKNESRSQENLRFRWGTKHLSVTFATVQETGTDQTGAKVVVFRDYTAEAELDQMKDAFVSMASHELRTPLNAILGHSDMLKEGVFGPMTSEQRTSIDRIVANVNRLLALVNNLLDSAQIEAGKLTIHRGPFDIRRLVDDIQATMKVLAEQRGLTLRMTVDEDIPDVLVSDAERIQQILINLIGNATKFTEKGGISVRVCRPDRAHWEMQIIDTGPGIPPEAHSYIFESFRQVDNTFTRHYPGSGLGLWIVKQLANLLGGEINVESEMGKGSTFTVRLPDLIMGGEKA